MARSDFDLLDEWQRGDRRAGNELFDRHFDSLHRFFHHRVPVDAVDLVQATFLRCVESRGGFRREASFRTFLFAIARNELLGHLRRRARDGALDPTTASIHDVGPTPSTLVRQSDDALKVADALRRLPIDLAIALELYYLEELTAEEVARIIGVPEGTVRSRLRRALDAMAAELTGIEMGDHEGITASLLARALES